MSTLPDPARGFCSERCAEEGDPPCYEVVGEEEWSPCRDCLIDCGIEPVEPLDPDAVVARLI